MLPACVNMPSCVLSNGGGGVRVFCGWLKIPRDPVPGWPVALMSP